MATIPQERQSLHVEAPVQSMIAGAVVVGGDHPGLGIARSLGRRGIPVYVVEDQYCISSFSKYVARVVQVESILQQELINSFAGRIRWSALLNRFLPVFLRVDVGGAAR